MFAFLPTCKTLLSYSIRKHLVMLSRGSRRSVQCVPNLRAIAKYHGSHYADSTPVELELTSCRFELLPQRKRIPASPLPLVIIFVSVHRPGPEGTADWPLGTDLFQAGTVSPQSSAKMVSQPTGDLEMLKNSTVPQKGSRKTWFQLDLRILPAGTRHWCSHLQNRDKLLILPELLFPHLSTGITRAVRTTMLMYTKPWAQ